MWALGERSINKRHEMIEVTKDCADDLTLHAGIGLVETGEEPTAGIEIGGHLWCGCKARPLPTSPAGALRGPGVLQSCEYSDALQTREDAVFAATAR